MIAPAAPLHDRPETDGLHAVSSTTPAAIDATSAGAADRRLLVLAILLGLAVAGGLSIAAWATGLVLYADGALFSFIIGLDDAWPLVWHIMPARIAVYLMTVLPAEVARDAGLPALAAMRLYQALFIGFPFIGLAACVPLLPRGARWLLLFPTVSILALGISALGYPSETLLTLSGFWPALFGHRYARGALAGAALTLCCTAIFLFSHPGMVFALPLLPLAALLCWRECRDGAVRRRLVQLGIAEAALLALWAWRLSIEMSDPGIIRSGQRMWSLGGLEDVITLQPAIAIVLLYIVLWAVLGWRRGRGALWLALAAFPAIALLFGLLHTEIVTPESHYYIRTALVFLLPVLGALALWRGRTVPRGAVLLVMTGALAATQLQHNLSFLGAWLNYRDSLAASVSVGPARVVPLQQILAGRAVPTARSTAWSWGQPYLSLTLPGLPRYAAIVADPAPTSYSPFRCSQMDDVIARADWVPADTLAVLKDYVCARRPD
ncbi:MAG: hypothetical protein WDN69_26860 [Aliidongia sp.]